MIKLIFLCLAMATGSSAQSVSHAIVDCISRYAALLQADCDGVDPGNADHYE